MITTVLPIPSPNWQVVTFNPDYQVGFNLGGRYVFANSGSDLQLNWSHLRTNDTDNVFVNPSSQWILLFLRPVLLLRLLAKLQEWLY
ncbi:Lpg1974 family pore-forming outer membrane protein [Legionella pneumophila 130b]|nr:Lpg1974 family pore-forming outer membrane protein [Legionella pneumophila 130b]